MHGETTVFVSPELAVFITPTRAGTDATYPSMRHWNCLWQAGGNEKSVRGVRQLLADSAGISDAF